MTQRHFAIFADVLVLYSWQAKSKTALPTSRRNNKLYGV